MPKPTINPSLVSAASQYVTGATHTLTGLHSHPDGDDLYLIYARSYNVQGIPSGVARNSVAFTLLEGGIVHGGAGNFQLSVWRLAAAAGGTNDIVVTRAGTGDNIGGYAVVSVSGVASLGTVVEQAFTNTNPTSINLSGDSDVLHLCVGICRRANESDPTVVTGSSNGTELSNTAWSTTNTLGDRVVVFTKDGTGSTVAAEVSYGGSPIYRLMTGIPLQGSSGGGGGPSAAVVRQYRRDQLLMVE